MDDPQQPNTENRLRRAAPREEEEQPTKKPRFAGSSAASNFSPLVLQAVAASQFLTTKELGRLLLLSSKELTASAFFSPQEQDGKSEDGGGELLWKSLCLNYLGTEDGEALLQTLQPHLGSAEQCFRKLVAPDLPCKYSRLGTPTPRPPLRFTPNDYVVIFTVRDPENNQPLFCKAIPGQQIPEFFDTGSVQITVDPFVPIKTIKDFFGADGGVIGTNTLGEVEIDELEYSVRILRCPDRKIVQIVRLFVFDAQCPMPSDSYHEKTSGDKHWILEPSGASWTQASDTPMNATYGSPLFRRYCYFPYTKIDFLVEPTFRLVRTGNTRDGAVRLSGLALKSYFESDHDESDTREVSAMLEGQDVTFAHFLEGLDKWFIP